MSEIVQAIRSFALSSSAYTAIVTPIPCNCYELVGTSDGSGIIRSSDGTDTNSYALPVGSWYTFDAALSPWSRTKNGTRWQAGDTVTYVKAATGSPNIFVEFSL